MALSGLGHADLEKLMQTVAANLPAGESVEFNGVNPLKTVHTVIAVLAISQTALFLCIRLYTRCYVTNRLILFIRSSL